MAPFVWSYRGNFNRFLSDAQLLQYLIILISLFNFSVCLYEDQVGKFDWKHNYVGKIKFARFDTVSTAKKIIVATEENVIAALNLKSGQIIWRRVFERGYAGRIHALGSSSDKDFISVSGGVPAIVRVWNLETGHIINEWPVAERNPDRTKDVKWHIQDGMVHQILLIYNEGVKVISYDSVTGEKLKTRMVSTELSDIDVGCAMAAPYLVCANLDLDQPMLSLIDIFKTENNRFMVSNINGRPYRVSPVLGDATAVSVSTNESRFKQLLVLNESTNIFDIIRRDIDEKASLYITTANNQKVLLETVYNNGTTEISAFDLLKSTPVPHLSVVFSHSSVHAPSIVASVCLRQAKGIACRNLLSSEDHSIALLQHNKLVWVREEALSNIVSVEILELPMSDRDQAIESEFDQKERDIISMFLRRISSQINQVKTTLQSAMGMTPQPTTQRADLVRDRFGLHKMIVVVTSAGKVYGIETRKGEIIWHFRIPNIRGLMSNSNKVILYVQRSSRHFPHPAQCALLAADKTTGNGVIYTFDPITGQQLGDIVKLDYKIKQTSLLHVLTEDFLRGILILDENDKIHIFPENATSVATSVGKNTYLFTVDQGTGVLSGYSLSYSTPDNLAVVKEWEITMLPKNQKITHVISKNSIERVHSQGRVLSDRSVLYKYINPNLVAIVTQSSSSTQTHTLSLYLLDVVSGAMIFSVTHKRAREPVHVVHSENWLVYSYFNEKSRRTEIATLELYEGKTQSNTTAFSSLTNLKLPIVERQAFIFPSTIVSMRETITEKGITSKHIIVALANGGILELPWMLVDPRRPINPELREEGVIPYVPEIPIYIEEIINYNQSVRHVSGIYTSPSGLESTCLVFVYGLDLFYTRVAPSKTFDVLKEDFDYYLIIIVLTALLVSSYITKKLASQKAQKQAWK